MVNCLGVTEGKDDGELKWYLQAFTKLSVYLYEISSKDLHFGCKAIALEPCLGSKCQMLNQCLRPEQDWVPLVFCQIVYLPRKLSCHAKTAMC